MINLTPNIEEFKPNEDSTNKAVESLKSIPNVIKKSAVLPTLSKRYKKEEIEDNIEKNYGIITIICNELDCTAKQFYNYVKENKLENLLLSAKQQLVGIAEKAILDCLNSENENIKLKAAQTTLESLGKKEWSKNPNVIVNQNVISDSDKAVEIKNIFGIQDN